MLQDGFNQSKPQFFPFNNWPNCEETEETSAPRFCAHKLRKKNPSYGFDHVMSFQCLFNKDNFQITRPLIQHESFVVQLCVYNLPDMATATHKPQLH